MILVNEIFETIQGEGSYTGMPSVFIRTQGCGVGCQWCDTKHTWAAEQNKGISVSDMLDKEEDSEHYAMLKPADLVDMVRQRYSSKHFVITGGEPMEQEHIAELFEEFSMLPPAYSVQMETSGTQDLEKVDDRIFVTLSPKYNMLGKMEVIESNYYVADELKFPIASQKDVDKFTSIMDEFNIGYPVYLQPVSQHSTATRLCIETARRYTNVRVSFQIHKYVGLR